MKQDTMGKNTPFFMLFIRLILFAAFQGIVALVFLMLGHHSPWNHAEGYWIISGFLTNVIVFILLMKLFKVENSHYFAGLRFRRKDYWKDLLIALGIMILAVPISSVPNIFLARTLFGSEDVALQLFLRPLPIWAIITGFFWAITQGLVELPTYFSYVMPRIEKRINNGWIAWALASFFLALQHIAIPLIFEPRFILWRFGMFLPFAFFLGLCIKIRPRLFPYLMITHALMDIVVVIMLVQVSL